MAGGWWLAAGGWRLAAGGKINVLNCNGADAGTGSAEDRWVGFAADHIANIGRMMSGANGFGGGRASFKNAHQGIDGSVCALNVQTTPGA